MKLLLAGLLASYMMMGLSACRTEIDESYGYGYGYPGYDCYGYPGYNCPGYPYGGGGVVIVGHEHDHDDHGGWHHEGGGEHGGGAPHGGAPHGGHHLDTDAVASADLSSVALPAAQAPVDSAALLANDYGLKIASAQKILVLASGKNMDSAAQDLGISKMDLAPLADLSMPSQSVIAKMAAKLGEPQDKIQQVFADFVRDISAEQEQEDDSL